MTESILQEILSFLNNLFETLQSGVLFFGSPIDIALAVIDIAVTTLVVYFVLKLIRDSRAWQLLKGIVLIVIFSQLFSLIGMQTMGFILTNTLSVLAIAFVVIFQPELRRALETVGRSSFTIISGVINQDAQANKNAIYGMIDSVVRAAEKMVTTNTGALIIIERETKLGELSEQDNAVVMDSAVSATLLMQIFYKGSPLHDGAVLIRNGRISAARCHVPLSDNYNLRRDFGTRHRAAIGVSEMGDAIAVVLSEERGAISVAIDGRLFTLDNSDALRTILHKHLDADVQGGVLSQIIKSTKIRKKDLAENSKTITSDDKTTAKKAYRKKRLGILKGILPKSKSTSTYSRKSKLIMVLSSFMIALSIWLYVQITVNPVETRSFIVPIKIEGAQNLNDRSLDYEISTNSVNVTLKGRSNNMNSLSSADINAVLDISDIDGIGRRIVFIDINIEKMSYFRTESIVPSSVSVNVVVADE